MSLQPAAAAYVELPTEVAHVELRRGSGRTRTSPKKYGALEPPWRTLVWDGAYGNAWLDPEDQASPQLGQAAVSPISHSSANPP